MRKLTVVVAIAVSLGWSMPAPAKEGLSLGIGLGGSGFIGKDLRNAIDPGPEGSVSLEFGITESLSLRGVMSGSVHTGRIGEFGAQGTVGLWGFRLGPGYYFRPESALRPFLEAGVGVYGLSSSRGYSMMSYGSGSRWSRESLISWGLDLGTGFEYFLRESVSIGFRLGYLLISYPAASNDGRDVSIRGDAVSGLFTVTYHFAGMGMHMMHHGQHEEEEQHEK